MTKLIAVDKWIEQISEMIDRLSGLDCEKCLPEWLDGVKENGIISDYTINETSVSYTIDGIDVIRELL